MSCERVAPQLATVRDQPYTIMSSHLLPGPMEIHQRPIIFTPSRPSFLAAITKTFTSLSRPCLVIPYTHRRNIPVCLYPEPPPLNQPFAVTGHIRGGCIAPFRRPLTRLRGRGPFTYQFRRRHGRLLPLFPAFGKPVHRSQIRSVRRAPLSLPAVGRTSHGRYTRLKCHDLTVQVAQATLPTHEPADANP